MPLRISTGEVCTFANTWHCAVHGPCGDINGPVHYAVCATLRKSEQLRELRQLVENPPPGFPRSAAEALEMDRLRIGHPA